VTSTFTTTRGHHHPRPDPGPRQCSASAAAPFEELEPQRLDLGEDTVHRRLVDEGPRQHRLGAVRLGMQAGARSYDRLAEHSSNTDLVVVAAPGSFMARVSRTEEWARIARIG
jgi:hypothetical protein